MYGFAAYRGQTLVGLVHVIEHDSCWTIKPYAYLQDLYVDEAARAKGVGRQLIAQVEKHCLDYCDRVYWLTHESNHQARLLYDQVAQHTGFIQYRLHKK